MRPIKPDAVRKAVRHYVQEYIRYHVTASKGQRNGVQKYITQVWPDDETRHLCLGWIFREDGEWASPMRMADLSDAQIIALKRWIGAKMIGGEWLPETGWEQEADWIRIVVQSIQKENTDMPPKKKYPAEEDPIPDKVMEVSNPMTMEALTELDGHLSEVKYAPTKLVELAEDEDSFTCDES